MEFGPKQREMKERKFCVIHTMTITDGGRYRRCFKSLLMSLIFTLSTKAKFLSFSKSKAFIDLVSG
jgi:hypothetical protein